MVKVSQLFLLLSSLCLVSPVMADQRTNTFQEILQSSKEIDDLDDGVYDDGDYASEPVVQEKKKVKVKKTSQPVVTDKTMNKPQAKMEKQPTPVASNKADSQGKTFALKANWEKQASIAPFE